MTIKRMFSYTNPHFRQMVTLHKVYKRSITDVKDYDAENVVETKQPYNLYQCNYNNNLFFQYIFINRYTCMQCYPMTCPFLTGVEFEK